LNIVPAYVRFDNEKVKFHRHSYNLGNMAQKFLPGNRKLPDYEWNSTRKRDTGR